MKTCLLFTIGILLSLLAFSGCASTPQAVGIYTPEDIDAKNLTPAPGMALVYFFYGRDYGWGNIEISLDSASSPINGQMYVLWEVPAGTYSLAMIMPENNELSLKIAKTSVKAPAGSIQFYRTISYKEEESDPVSKVLYQLVPARDSDGKKFVQAFSLVSWFRNGERIYYNDALPNLAK